MPKVLLVEDDELSAVEVRRLLKNESPDFSVTKVATAREAARRLQKELPDVLLIDVILEDASAGINLAKKVNSLGVPFIFITSSQDEELFRKAKMTQPISYFQKPLSSTALRRAIELALIRSNHQQEDAPQNGHQSAGRKDYLFVKCSGGQLEKISFDSIQLIEAFGNYCHIYTATERYTQRVSLTRFLSMAPAREFVRIHRNFIASIHHLESVDTKANKVYIRGEGYPLGLKYKTDILNMLPRV